METQHTVAAPAARRPSSAITAGIGIVVAIVALVFAFDSSWYPHWYAFFRVVHVAVAVFWVGGGLTLTVLGLKAERANDPNEMATVARQAAFVGERLFAPAGLVVLLMGIAMMIHTDWGWGKFWVVIGLLGYAATFATGIGVLSPLAKRISTLLEEKGPDAPETQAAISRILLVARVDVGVLLLVVVDMVAKPFSG
jgi:uncharacterized membrane protein